MNEYTVTISDGILSIPQTVTAETHKAAALEALTHLDESKLDPAADLIINVTTP